MSDYFNKLETEYDVIIVGGGVNGCGILRDCALRGVKALLIEKKDFSKGTSWASSGMIHGGPRYLLNDKEVTRLSCLDSGYIQKIAPHLLFRIPFLYPVYKEKGQTALQARVKLEAVEAFFEAYDNFVHLKNGKKHTRLSAEEVRELEPNVPAENLLGGVTFDEWGIDVPRLCISNIVDAVENGSEALNHTEVIEVYLEDKNFKGVKVRDVYTGKTKVIHGKYLINATGPWSPQFSKMFGSNIKLRGGKGIHLVFDRRLFNMAISSQAIDGREIFVMPYENTTIIGTTDDDYFGDLDEQKSTEEEIEYLLDGIEQVFPDIKKAKMIYSYSGVRPTLYERNCSEDELSREHELIDHEKHDNIKGVISVTGGKLASYRIMSEEAVDLLCEKLGVKEKSSTHSHPLPGGDKSLDIADLVKKYEQDPFMISRLVYRHGSRAEKILDMMKDNPEWAMCLCPCEPVTEAELRYVVKNEKVRTLSDVRMRTRLTQGPCQGTNCLLPANSILNELISDENQEEGIKDFMNEWWWNRAAILNGDQLMQEELLQAVHFCNNSLDL